MILRLPTAAGADRAVRLDFGEGVKPTELTLDTCSADLCLGYLPVGPEIRKAIGKGLPAQVATTGKDGGPIAFSAPVKGLALAIAGLK